MYDVIGIEAWNSVRHVPPTSMALQTEILSTETSDFLQQIVFLKSFNSMLYSRLSLQEQY